jgi:transposase
LSRTFVQDVAASDRPVSASTRRDDDDLETRRLRAARLFAAGLQQCEVARRLGVSAVSVHRWLEAWTRGGVDALRKAGCSGRKPRLSRAELRRLDCELRKGPSAHGFDTGTWTLSRVAEVMEAVTGEHYHRSHVWRILRGEMQWSLQRHSCGNGRKKKAVRTWCPPDAAQ